MAEAVYCLKHATRHELGFCAVCSGDAGAAAATVRAPAVGETVVGLKRAIDLVVAVALIVATLPVMVVIAIAVKLGDGGPILFRQPRVGRGGKPFQIIKFRTMVEDAERMLDADPELQELYRKHAKVPNDPRITRVGRVLRVWSLDELPQLFNVVSGAMSIVGPRPMLPGEADWFGSHLPTVTSIRPGVTGPWQAGGRNELTFADRVQLEAEYAASWSLTGDAQIVLRTVGAVVSRRGAG